MLRITWELIEDTKDTAGNVGQVFLCKMSDDTWNSGIRNKDGTNRYPLPTGTFQGAIQHLQDLGFSTASQKLRRRALASGKIYS